MYNQTGAFPGEQIKPARRPWTLLNFLCWATVLLSPLFSFVLGVFASGSPLLILTFLGFVGAGKEHDVPAHMLGSLGCRQTQDPREAAADPGQGTECPWLLGVVAVGDCTLLSLS